MPQQTRLPRFLVWLGLLLARLLPVKTAYWLCARIAALLSRRRAPMFTVLRHNLAHVAPERDAATLDAMAERGLALALRTYYESFRTTATGGRWAVHMAIDDDCPLFEWALDHQRSHSAGLMVCGLHVANFDAAGAWLVQRGIEVQALSLANPDPGTEMINALRRQQGLEVTPIDPSALRTAIRRLRAGGVVLTGIDRPAHDGNQPVRFFGQVTEMPVGHVRLALQTDAAVLLMVCYEESPGAYRVACSPPLKMERTGDRQQDILANTSRLLALAEEFIRQAPEQWLVFVPVWPADAQPVADRSVP